MKKLITINEAAKILNVSKETLRRWDKTGKFKSYRNPINNYRVYDRSEVENLLKEFNINYEKHTAIIDRTLYFETSLGKLYHTDALTLLKSLADKSVDLIFADPPYNIKKAEWDIFSSHEAYLDWTILWVKEAKRVLKDTGSLYICGFSEILADIKYLVSPMFAGVKWLVWYYRNKANLRNDWGRSHESILHLRMSKSFTFNVDAARVPYNQHTLKYPQRTQAETSQYANTSGKYVWQPHPLGAKPKDVLEIPTISNSSWERFAHETQKPVELLKKIILSSSNENDIVVDPFGGSGTTYAVAEAFNRKWLGSEIHEKYCQIINNRLNDPKHIDRIRAGEDEKLAQIRRKKLRG